MHFSPYYFPTDVFEVNAYKHTVDALRANMDMQVINNAVGYNMTDQKMSN